MTFSIHKIFGVTEKEAPLRMAKKPITLTVSDEDIASAVKGDHHRCVYARAASRKFKTSMVWFGTRYAYVMPWDEEKKSHFIDKYSLQAKMGEKVKTFDVDGSDLPRSIILNPLSHTRTPDGLKENDKRKKTRVAKLKVQIKREFPAWSDVKIEKHIKAHYKVSGAKHPKQPWKKEDKKPKKKIRPPNFWMLRTNHDGYSPFE